MNPPWQPNPKRFRPNEPSSNRPWVPPPHPPLNHQHVHPSRQSQLPPPPPIAPYHAPPQNAPYYPQHLVPNHAPPHHNPYHPSHHPQHPPSSSSSRRNKSMDPRQRHRQHHAYNDHPSPTHHNENTNSTSDAQSMLDVLHIASDESKNFGPFAVTLSLLSGSRNVDGLPFGTLRSTAIEFDGRIGSAPILSFLPEAIDTPSKKVRVYEVAPLAASDKRSYDELLAFFTKHERCPVVDKEYNMGILLYFVPPKLIFKKVEPMNIKNKDKDKKNKHKRKRAKNAVKQNKINFVELFKLSANASVKEDRLWMISITSTSKYLMYKQKLKEKESDHGNKEKDKDKIKGKRHKKKKDETDMSDIDISCDEEEDDDDDEYDEDDEDGIDINDDNMDNVTKSDLIVALEELYNKIGQKLPD